MMAFDVIKKVLNYPSARQLIQTRSLVDTDGFAFHRVCALFSAVSICDKKFENMCNDPAMNCWRNIVEACRCIDMNTETQSINMFVSSVFMIAE